MVRARLLTEDQAERLARRELKRLFGITALDSAAILRLTKAITQAEKAAEGMPRSVKIGGFVSPVRRFVSYRELEGRRRRLGRARRQVK